MTAPNLKTPTTIVGKTAVASAATTLTAVLDNAAASGKLLKINTIRAANVDSGAAAVAIDVSIFRSSTHRYLIKNAAVSTAKALVVTDRNEQVYLEEGDSIYAKAATSSGIDLTINYEEIS